jgi:2-amino-4-hydroxy-6-hydroxymethyldihydropteridine diphosphokinase
MSSGTRAYIAVGSNIEPLRHIPRCLRMLAEIPECALRVRSSWYHTRPWGIRDQPDFVNLVVGVDTCLAARTLMQATQEIELRLDRVRATKNGPRTIDLDILLFGDQVLSDEDMVIPHPGLLLRDFMLIPLIEIAPDALHPIRGRPVSLLEKGLQYRQIVERFTAPTDTG